MSILHIRSLSLPVLALFVFAGSAAAQEKSGAVLNSLDVQQLVKRAEPGDIPRLAAHFSALADRYVADAKQHTTMATGYTGNAGRSLATGMSGHCKQLADLNTQSATEARELATYYQKLGSGAAGTPPAAGSRFEGGAGAPAPTKQDLSALAAKASTPADHRALQEYFLTLATQYTKDATDYATTASTFRGTKMASAAVHGDSLVRLSKESAKEATAAASMHKQLAGVGR